MTQREMLIKMLKELSILESEKFKAQAYKRASNTLFNISDNEFDSMETYTSLPGIGKNINAKIEEFKTSGKISKLETLRVEKADTLDPKLYKVRKSFITKRIPLEQADSIYENEILKYIGSDFHISLAGSYRRRADYIADLDILVLNSDTNDSITQLKKIVKLLDSNPNLTKLVEGDMKVSYKINNAENTQIDLTACKPETDGFAILHFTGPKEFNIMCRNIAINKGYRLSQNGLRPINDYILPISFSSEKEIIAWLGLNKKYLSPINR